MSPLVHLNKSVLLIILYLEQHIRGRSVLGELLQRRIHKIAEIIRPVNFKKNVLKL